MSRGALLVSWIVFFPVSCRDASQGVGTSSPSDSLQGIGTSSLFPMLLADARTTREEINTALPVAKTQRDAERVVVYSTAIDLLPGDLLQTSAEISLHNHLDYTVAVSTKIVLGENQDDTEGIAWVTPQNGSNITPATHKLSVAKTGILLVPTDLPPGTYHLNLVAHAGSTRAIPGDLMRIQAGHGHLYTLIFRKETP